MRVIDAEGTPVVGAWVTVRSLAGSEFHGVDDTDAEGWASLFGLPEGPVLMDVSHGIAGRRFGVPIDASVEELEFVLEARGSLQLRLVDGEEALAGVLTRIETSSGVTLSDAKQTDDQGLVRFEPLGEGNYRLGCRRGDCWPSVVEHALGADEQATVTVQMRRLADLELTVFNRDGIPVSAVEVGLNSSEFQVPVQSWLDAEQIRAPGGLTSDERGKIRIEGLPRGKYSWSVPVEGQACTGTLELVPGKTNEAAIRLPL